MSLLLNSLKKTVVAFILWPMLVLAAEESAANCLSVEGVAQISQGDRAYARQMAIRDAMAQAVLASKVKVTALAETTNYTLTKQTAHFSAQQQVSQMQLLSERVEGDQMRVVIRACMSDSVQTCPTYIARYLPKVAIASIAIQDEYSVKDIRDIHTGYQGELHRRLWSRGMHNVEQIVTASDLYFGSPLTPNLSSPVIREVANRSLAQYLILSVIRSADWEVEQSRLEKELRHHFKFDKEPNQRTVDVDWYVIDLANERVLSQGNAFKSIANSDVRVGRDKPFASRPFFNTATGQLFDFVLNEQVASIQDSLACAPLSTQIAEVDGDRVVVPISIETGVAKGDLLSVYHLSSRPYRLGGVELGQDMEPTAFIRVEKVLPKLIIARFEGKKGRVDVGDLVKSW